MFRPGECFKAALVLPPLVWLAETVVYHQHGWGVLVLAGFMGVVPLLFGIYGLRG